MKSLLSHMSRALPLIAIILLCIASPVSAALNQVVLVDRIFLTAEEGFYNEAIQSVLVNLDSPLASYQETLGDRQTSAAEIIWLGSQHMDFGINPKILLINLQVLGWLEHTPQELLTPFVQSMAETLWEGYTAFFNGSRSVTLKNGTTVQINDANAGTYALAYYFAQNTEREAALSAILSEWQASYQEIFGVDPAVEEQISVPHSVPVVAPFLRLPYQQPADNFIGITSFFDHATPSIFDDSITRFDGKTLSPAGFSPCILGVTCYGGHNGIDYRTGAGLPIRAAADGVVVYKYYNTNSSAGNVDSGLYIDHNNGYRTAYWHMDPIMVEYGQTVKAGDIIGLSGNIGKSSGPHLHFGLRLVEKNKPVDPYGWWSTASADSWGDSYWMWNGDLTADSDEAQAQLFYIFHWWRVAQGYGGDSFWTYEVSTSGSSTNWGMWGAYIQTPGQYNVYAYWPPDSTNTKKARYQVFHAGGSTTVQVDQSVNGGQFVNLGTYTFERGAASVFLSDYTGGSGGKVQFDAVKWELASGSPTPQPFTIGVYDDNDGRLHYNGTWALETLSGAYSSTRHSSTATGASLTLDFTGQQVGLLYSADLNRGSLEVYIDGVLTDTINQRSTGLALQKSWRSVAVSPGWHHLELSNAGGGMVDLDAVTIYDSVQTGTPQAPTAVPTVPTSTPVPNRINLALNKAASQSSAFPFDPSLGLAGLAVDGNTNGVWGVGSTTHTNSQSQPWWQVDLGSVQAISQISLWNRSDCCSERLSDFYLLVSDAPFSSTDLNTARTQGGVSSFYFPSGGGTPTTFDVNRTGRYVRVQLSGANYLSLAEVQVWSNDSAPIITATPIQPTSTPTATVITPTQTLTPTPTVVPPTNTPTPSATPTGATSTVRTNLALSKPAEQSSNFGTDPIRGKAGLAVDGITEGNYFFSSTSHTTYEINPWWQVDLGSVQAISQISLWNRSDCCSERLSNFYVLVSDLPFTSTNLTTVKAQSGVSFYFFADIAGYPTTFEINRTGRYVRVQLAGTNPLSLSEVQVWSPGSAPVVTATPTYTNTVPPIPNPTGTPVSNTPTPTSIPPTPTLTPTAVPPTITPTATAVPTRTNLALNKPASQSSTYGLTAIIPSANLAVDGNTSGVFSAGTTTHTNSQAQPWWQVDLGSVQAISQIDLWNRSDCCSERLSNFYVLVSDIPFIAGDLNTVRAQSGVSSYSFANTASNPTAIQIYRSGRYVRVQLAGTNPLSLSEVQVWSNPAATPGTTTPIGIVYQVQAGYPFYIPNFAHPESGDAWLGIAGQIFNESGTPVNQVVVTVKGTLNGQPFEKISLSGLAPAYGAGGFEVLLGSIPVASTGTLSITLSALSGEVISTPFSFNTYADPLRNLVLINFKKK